MYKKALHIILMHVYNEKLKRKKLTSFTHSSLTEYPKLTQDIPLDPYLIKVTPSHHSTKL